MNIIMTEVKHSKSKDAWYVIGTELGKKYKIARFPYTKCEDAGITEVYRKEAKEHAEFFSSCMNFVKAVK